MEMKCDQWIQMWGGAKCGNPAKMMVIVYEAGLTEVGDEIGLIALLRCESCYRKLHDAVVEVDFESGAIRQGMESSDVDRSEDSASNED